MVFSTAIWATFIHDTMDTELGWVMGARYHTVHHTHYMYNFGQVFTFADWWWGTLREPDGKTTDKQRGGVGGRAVKGE